MEKPSLFLFFPLLLFSILSGRQQCVRGWTGNSHRPTTGRSVSVFKPNKLFVFGDSYADTGNDNKSLVNSWSVPYGITFPGKPSGRFSDGRVSTDFIAKYLNIKTPVPYRWRKLFINRLKYGMNFAYGGTGVFNTLIAEPNMTIQIDYLQQLLNESVYTKRKLRSSMALVSLAGNDYSTYTEKNGSPEGWQSFIQSVVDQLAVNMKRIHNMGVRKVAVNTLQPLGCLPRSTSQNSFRQCNTTENNLVDFHNVYLQQAIEKLNTEVNSTDNRFITLDLHSAFWTVFNNETVHQGESTFENPYEPCCFGISSQYSCGSVDGNGVKKYTLCADRKSRFFWDAVHPTQEGWYAIFSTPAMQKSLEQF
ncbi:hypothetical protein SLA2020_147350 [Shorea laevis]